MLTGRTSPENLTLADLYDVYESKLLRYATIMVGDPDWAEDLVQETFMRSISHLQLLGSLEPYQRLAWLRTVLKNHFIDQQRAHQREQAMVEQIVQETEIAASDSIPLLTGELLELAPEKDRDLLIQRYILGMNSQEISDQIGVPAATVRSRLHLALKKLRAIQKWKSL